MVPKDLIPYLDSLKAMLPKPPASVVRQSLLTGGWNAKEIEESISYFEAKEIQPIRRIDSRPAQSSAPVSSSTISYRRQTVSPEAMTVQKTPEIVHAVEREPGPPVISPAPSQPVAMSEAGEPSFVVPDWAHPNFSAIPSEVEKKAEPEILKPVPREEKMTPEEPLVKSQEVKFSSTSFPKISPKIQEISSQPSIAVVSRPVPKIEKAVPVPKPQAVPETATKTPAKGEVASRRFPRKALVALGVVSAVLLVAGSSLGTAYYAGFWPFDNPPYSKEEFLAGFSKEAEKLRSSVFSTALSVQTASYTESGGQEESSQSSLSDLSSYVATYLPANIRAAFFVTGTFDSGKKGNEGSVALSGEAQFGDFLAAVDIETIRKNDALFVRINKFPHFLGDIDAIRGAWIKTEVKDVWLLTEIFGGRIEKIEEISILEKAEGSFVSTLIAKGTETGYLASPSLPVKEDVEGERAYRYEIRIVPEKLPDFLVSLKEFYGSGRDWTDEEEKKMIDNARDWQKNSSTFVWLDRSGEPVKISSSYRFVPAQEGGWKGKQLISSVSLTLKDRNNSEEVTPPMEFISGEQAILLVKGITKEEYALESALKTLTKVREGLNYYERLFGGYPSSLDVFIASKDIPVKSGSIEDGLVSMFKASSYKTFKEIPADAFTKEPLSYTRAEDDYALRYTVEFPQYSPKSVRKYIDIDSKGVTWKYVSGLNTADKKTLSIEAVEASKSDNDKDGLPDSLEAYIGTDSSKKDSNGDGLTDGEEFIREILSVEFGE